MLSLLDWVKAQKVALQVAFVDTVVADCSVQIVVVEQNFAFVGTDFDSELGLDFDFQIPSSDFSANFLHCFHRVSNWKPSSQPLLDVASPLSRNANLDIYLGCGLETHKVNIFLQWPWKASIQAAAVSCSLHQILPEMHLQLAM